MSKLFHVAEQVRCSPATTTSTRVIKWFSNAAVSSHAAIAWKYYPELKNIWQQKFYLNEQAALKGQLWGSANKQYLRNFFICMRCFKQRGRWRI